ncbi:PEGA domain-containing protein [Polyangium sp. y55x31]|uniref:PEGA domain-containing protein n=1 Tax=Polyangium sp. y55x31 TaxID=3042688 RepID=UPI002482AEC7|nr:PEGA domain-containing protein [Polyangium sp. y55x31]MDI1476538.1 PEGA domain-containing protein [Polyangium sp. y55x31]
MARMVQKTLARSLLVAAATVLVAGAASAQPAAKAPAAAAKKPAAKKTAEAEPPPKPPLPPLADVLTGAAKDEYVGGKMLYETKDFANALVKFRKAYSLTPEPRLLKNIAVCEKDLRHYSRALALLEEYRGKAGDAITPEEEESLKALEAALRTLTSEVTLVVSEADAKVSVDGEPVGTAPIAKPVRMDVGDRKITVEKPGYKPLEIKKTIDGGTTLTVVAKLERDWRRGRIVIEAGSKDLIAIDGKVMGLGRYEGYVASGGHTVRVSAPGMAVYQNEVVVQDGETRRVPITLNPLPAPSDTSKWLWIGGGIVLAAGAAIGGAVLFRPTEVPPIDGTIGTVPLTFGGRR